MLYSTLIAIAVEMPILRTNNYSQLPTSQLKHPQLDFVGKEAELRRVRRGQLSEAFSNEEATLKHLYCEGFA